jgi:hypothetical protein
VVSDPKLDAKQTDFEQRAQTLLRESAEQLDGATSSRLTQARHAALAAAERRQSKTRYWLLPATGVAAAAVIAVALTNHSVRESEHMAATVADAAAIDDMEIVTADDSLEFYRDVDFYAWLAVIDEEAVPPEA